MWVEEVSETSWTASLSFSRWRLLVIPNSCSNSASVRLWGSGDTVRERGIESLKLLLTKNWNLIAFFHWVLLFSSIFSNLFKFSSYVLTSPFKCNCNAPIFCVPPPSQTNIQHGSIGYAVPDGHDVQWTPTHTSSHATRVIVSQWLKWSPLCRTVISKSLLEMWCRTRSHE